jgi:hypothetical protein
MISTASVAMGQWVVLFLLQAEAVFTVRKYWRLNNPHQRIQDVLRKLSVLNCLPVLALSKETNENKYL